MRCFLRASLSFAWLELKALRYYPVNGALQVVQSFVSVGIWFFVSLLLNDFAAPDLTEFGGDFVAYMVVGVLFFQNAGSVLTLPQQSLATAFWDKRLEVYHSQRHGIWAYVVGRLIWAFAYNAVMTTAVLAFGVLAAGVRLDPSMPLLPALAFYIVFTLTVFGIGLIGAGNFFFLEIKQGREPLTWVMNILVRLFSGVYYPLSIIPAGLSWVTQCLPHTYALQGVRQVMINGAGFGNADTLRAFLILLVFCVVSLGAGIWVLNRGLRSAEAGNGIAVVG